MNADTPTYELAMERGPQPGQIFPLGAPSHTVGRDPISDLCISDPEVSRQHGLLIRMPSGGYKLQDLGSTNGTIVDGVRLSGEAHALQPGQLIALGGSVALRYRLAADAPPADSEQARTGEEEAEAEQRKLSQATATAVEEQEDVPPQPAAAAAGDEWQERKPVREHSAQPRVEQRPSAAPEEEPFVDAPLQEENDPGRRLLSIALGVLLILLCLCCSLTVFMYYYGGDWLLRQFGVVP